MPIDQAIPTIVAARMIRHLADNAVYAARVNRAYTADARVGDQVDILPHGSVMVRDYNPADETEALDYGVYEPGAKKTINLDQHKYWAITIDDVHQRQAVPAVLQSGVMVAGQALVDQVDKWVAAQMHGVSSSHRNIGTAGTKVDFAGGLSAAEQLMFKETFRAAARKMSDAKVPKPWWAICGPVAMYALTEMFEQGQLGDATLQDSVRNGFSGSLYGLNVYQTSSPNGVTASTEQVLFGNDYGYAFITQMDKTERLRLEDRFADAVRGLAVYGGTFIEDAGFFEATINFENLPDFS